MLYAMIGECWTTSETETSGHWLEEAGGWLYNTAAESSSKYAIVVP